MVILETRGCHASETNGDSKVGELVGVLSKLERLLRRLIGDLSASTYHVRNQVRVQQTKVNSEGAGDIFITQDRGLVTAGKLKKRLRLCTSEG